MTVNFEDFTNLYPITKTLRFKLIPVGKTQYWIDKQGIIEEDETREKDAKRVKEIIDDFHRWFIEDVLNRYLINETLKNLVL